MKKYELKEILSLSLDIGEAMLKCGAEISRVEETIKIICDSYGIKYKEIFAMNSLIVATLRKDDDMVTESRRITYHENNLLYLEKLNELSRKICENKVPRKAVLKKIDDIRKKPSDLYIFIGKVIAASFFTMFFGGDIKDFFCSFIIAGIIHLFEKLIKYSNLNSLLRNFLYSFIIGVLAITMTKLHLGSSLDKIIIGDIMLLIPGLYMFISINDIFKGDTMSGLGKFTEGIFLALVVAAGIGFSLIIMGGLL